MSRATIHTGDALAVLSTMEASSVHTCVTSPPYFGLRDYGHEGQIGLEETPQAYVAKMVEVFEGVRRVLRDDGTLWLNLGDSYASGGMSNPSERSTLGGGKDRGAAEYSITRKVPDGLKAKDLIGIPWRVAFALQEAGWYLRAEIIWHKGNPMPESVTDRPTRSHEQIFLLSKSPRYFYDAEAVKEEAVTAGQAGLGFYPHRAAAMGRKPSGNEAGDPRDGVRPSNRNRRSVWSINTRPFPGAHFAVFPPDLVEPCVLAGTSERGCCPACGAPYERVVETGELVPPASRPDAIRCSGNGASTQQQKGRAKACWSRERNMTGWAPSCPCEGGPPVPCTVLDPFSGAGTTGLVALAKGRDYVGIELNPTYAAMAAERIAGDAPLLNAVSLIHPAVAA